MRTQVGIIGAGPAGLVLAHLLARAGIEAVILEARSRAYVEGRIRAGVMEHWVAELLARLGLGGRMRREGLVHRGIYLRLRGETHHIDFAALVGRTITVYGQQEVVKDLIAAWLERGGGLLFEAEAVAVEEPHSERPRIRFRHEGAMRVLECDWVAGCDGFHGVSRAALADAAVAYERVYPYAWLGILAAAPPPSEELIYANHERGFALSSMRGPHLSRLYLQVDPGTRLDDWPDERIWEELERRLHGPGFRLARGPVLQRGVTPMRSFVVEPMARGRLLLAGDAAHIVPPTGAKGMNLAVADVCRLAAALIAAVRHRSPQKLERYSADCLARVWKVQHFSWWMTRMLHRDPDATPFDERRQLGELGALVESTAARQWLAENYTGLPMDGIEELFA